MRRWLVLLIILLSAPIASAKVLVVVTRDQASETSNNLDAVYYREQVLGMLNALGVDYDCIRPPIAKTEFARTGVVTYNFGTSAAFTRSYDAVITILPNGVITSGGFGFRPDSLFSSTKRPQVPQLYMSLSYQWVGAGSGCAACSLGVFRTVGGYNNGNWQGNTMFSAGGNYKFRPQHLDGYLLTYGTGGVTRPVIAQQYNASSAQEATPTSGAPCMDCDSLLGSISVVDTVSMYVWYGAFNTVNPTSTQSKPIIVCDFAHSTAGQSTPVIGLAGIALLDSMCGGTIITKPIKAALYMTGAFQRNGRTTWGGISPNDTSNFKASLDSLASLGVPITVGVAIDSLSSYQADFGWYRRLGGLASYSPEVRRGTGADTTGLPASDPASFANPRDIFGHLRKRFQVGDGSGVGADSSIASLARGAFATLTSNGLTPLDRALVPPLWDNTNLANGTADTAFAGLAMAGVAAVVVDPFQIGNYGGRSAILSRYTRSQSAQIPGMGGKHVNVLGAATMAQDSSAARWQNGFSVDSYSMPRGWGTAVENFWDQALAVNGQAAAMPANLINALLISGAITNGRTSGVGSIVPMPKSNVFVFAASDLGSGVRSDWATRPTRPGWWAVKSIVNGAKLANSLCYPGKVAVAFQKLEDIQP